MSDIFFEILVRDDYRKDSDWKFPASKAAQYFKILNEKYGLGMKITDAKLEPKEKEKTDLDWAIK